MSHLSKQQQEQENFKWAMKYFDMAESPIKEWIAEFLEEDVKSIFSDYTGESDVISVEVDGKHYSFWVGCNMVEDVPSSNVPSIGFCRISKQFIQENPEISKCLTMTYDAVCKTFGAVVQSMEQFKSRLEYIIPVFDETNFSFWFGKANEQKIKIRRIQEETAYALHQKELLQKKVNESGNSQEFDNSDEAQKVKDLLEKIDMIVTRNHEASLDITWDMIQDEEKICQEFNDKHKNHGPRLYICADTTSQTNEDMIFKRLPMFGLKYQDPDEDNYIDALKKEYEVKE